MKNKNNLLLVLPIVVFLGTFVMLRALDNRSYAIESDTAEYTKISGGTAFDIVRKNIFSWHTVGGSSTPAYVTASNGALISVLTGVQSSSGSVGTWVMRSESKINGEYHTGLAYQATVGESFIQSRARKRYTLDGTAKLDIVSQTKRDKYKKVMQYMYPFKNLGATSGDSGTIKEALKSSTLGLNGTTYTDYDFDKLNVSEATAAAQAAIWAIQTGSNSYKYSNTLTSFAEFDTCEEYYTDKILTSQEKEWYAESQCSASGKFYKYVFQHYAADESKATTQYPYDANVKNRIDALIDWYINILAGKVDSAGTNVEQKFEIASKSFVGNQLTISFTIENIDVQEIIFTNESGTKLSATAGENNTYTVDVGDARMIYIEITSSNKTPHVIYYYSCKGTDLIGLENTVYNEKLNLNVERENETYGKIMLYKVGDSTKNVEVTNSTTGTFDTNKCGSKCLSGARFELYYQNKNNLIKEIQTSYGDNGLNALVIDNLPIGTYYLKETQAAKGYDLYKFGVNPVDDQGYITIVINNENVTNGVDIVVNDPYANDVCFSKIDSESKAKLTGATFIIQDINGSIIQDKDLDGQKNLGIFTITADEQVVCFDGKNHKRLESGVYFLKEISAPTGYSVSPTRYKFVVGSGLNDISTLEDVGAYVDAPAKDKDGVINIPNVKGLTLTKTNALDGTCVSGAKLELKDSAGKSIVNWTSTCSKDGDTSGYTIPICLTDAEKSSSSSTCITPGKYTLSETSVPKGYAKGDDVEITIGTDGKITGNPNVENSPIEVCIYKVKKGTEEVLSGAELEVYQKPTCVSKDDCESTLVTSFKSSDEPCISGTFDVGTYIVKETKAPDGYKLPENNETTIEVKNKAGKQNFYIENEVVAPKTSVDYSMTVIIIASIFMMFGIGLVGYYEYKKQH